MSKMRNRKQVNVVALRFHLTGLAREEIIPYFKSRLAQAAGENPTPIRLHRDTLDILEAYSSGIPRLLNLFFDRLLIGAFVHKTYDLDVTLAIQIQNELNRELLTVR